MEILSWLIEDVLVPGKFSGEGYVPRFAVIGICLLFAVGAWQWISGKIK